nr:uncharacterized protein LOC109174707 [Ipomoea batatas]
MTSRRLSGLNATPKYLLPDMYTLKLYYGGDLVQKPRVQYKDGRIEYFDNFSAEEGSILELRKMVKSLKFSDKKINFWFKFGSKSYPKVRQIKTDAELLSIMYEIPKNKEVEMFVEHVIEDQWDYEVEVEGYISDELWVESETDVPLEDWEFEVGDNVNVNAFVDATVNASVDATVDANVNATEVGASKIRDGAICRATTVPEYLTKMEELRKLNPKAADWVSAREPHHYCRAFFSSFPNCDILLNNLCESWNSSILQFRENGIMTMCENIRVYLMVRMQQNRDNMKKHPLKICPKIMKLVEEAKDKSNDCTAYRSKDDVYEVEDCYGRKYKVDLSQYHCSCRRWDLTGIPCSHNIAAIRRKGCIPEEYVNNCYTVESYLRSYEPAILPVTSSELWHKTGLPPPLPPKYKAQPGRPKRKRRMGLTESATDQAGNKGKVGESKRCTVCGMKGHNKRRCKAKDKQDMMNSQPSQNVGNHEPQVSNFISSHMEQLPTADNVIRKGGREYVTISTLQKKMKVSKDNKKKS